MISVGHVFPEFSLKAVKGGDLATVDEDPFVTLDREALRGRWTVLFAWPMDFTFVCPTELAEFGRRTADFADRDAQVVGLSTDTHFVHLAWRRSHEDLRDLPYPMLADTKRELSTALGILHPTEGVDLRATLIVDPDLVVRWVCVNDLSVGRSVPEVLRVLDALQTNELCPCNWQKGQQTLQAA
jgi:peroxiredoxin (alkyl hydroperoxide reductase subunit C)